MDFAQVWQCCTILRSVAKLKIKLIITVKFNAPPSSEKKQFVVAFSSMYVLLKRQRKLLVASEQVEFVNFFVFAVFYCFVLDSSNFKVIYAFSMKSL